MGRSLCLVCLFFVASLAGCQPTVQGPSAELSAAHPISSQELVSIRNAYHKRIPESRVGLVKDVKIDSALASVGDTTVADFQINDVISFLDSNGNDLASGIVEGSADNLLIVKFTVLPGGRAPTEGDLAVRIIK